LEKNIDGFKSNWIKLKENKGDSKYHIIFQDSTLNILSLNCHIELLHHLK